MEELRGLIRNSIDLKGSLWKSDWGVLYGFYGFCGFLEEVFGVLFDGFNGFSRVFSGFFHVFFFFLNGVLVCICMYIFCCFGKVCLM